jgi:hypothetical protein
VLEQRRVQYLSPVAAGGDRRSGDLRAGGLHQPGLAENSADFLWRKIAATLAPADAPMIPPND